MPPLVSLALFAVTWTGAGPRLFRIFAEDFGAGAEGHTASTSVLFSTFFAAKIGPFAAVQLAGTFAAAEVRRARGADRDPPSCGATGSALPGKALGHRGP